MTTRTEPTRAIGTRQRPAGGELAFDRSVDRSLVHRAAVAEVFVTDSAPTGEHRYGIAAQLPRAHAYYNDHMMGPALTDPLLLLECCRQAGTVVAHRHLGVPRDAAFLISDWTVTFAPDVLSAPADGVRELRVDMEVAGRRQRGDRLLGATLITELHLDGRFCGAGTITTGYLPRDDYLGFRTMRRRSPAPSSSSMPRERPGDLVDPRQVGLHRRENVVLAGVRGSPGRAARDGAPQPGGLTARLDVPVGHPTFYDHPLDHVPAMALLEAARQAAILAVPDPRPGTTWLPAAIRTRFQRFVELDADTTVIAAETTATTGTTTAERTVTVEFHQAGATMCTAEVTLTTVGEAVR